MKGKHLQPMLLFSARISLRLDGETNNFTEKDTEKEFSTNNSFITKDKGTSLGRNHKEKKRPPRTNQKQLTKR